MDAQVHADRLPAFSELWVQRLFPADVAEALRHDVPMGDPMVRFCSSVRCIKLAQLLNMTASIFRTQGFGARASVSDFLDVYQLFLLFAAYRIAPDELDRQ